MAATLEDNNKATPYAALLNPLAKADVIVWYQKDGYLYLESKPIDPPSAKSLKQAARPLFPGYDESEIIDGSVHATATANANGNGQVSTLVDGTPKDTPKVPFGSCVAITTTSTAKLSYAFAIRDLDKTLCMISPVYSPLGKNTADGVGIASCLINKIPHVFSIRKDDNVNKIYNTDPFSLKTVLISDFYNPIDQSQLCAISMSVGGASPAPYVFWHQGGKKAPGIYFGDVTQGHFEQIKKITSWPDPTTPLAVCQYEGSVFLFHLNSDYNVACTKYSNGNWGPVFVPTRYDSEIPSDDGQPLAADTLSGLSAVADPENDRIVITYKAFVDEDHPDVSPCTIYSLLDPLSQS
ncbi:unnamed protein product [Clonostachys rosea]|uniref:Fucose-specific lectin n=1 Tax=Bionectria ochroleuca TaxID=29856 RepID=A0ABY6U2K1_BIOOC|nr:unnamed protein product [Clonostachys rosea]